MIVKFKKNTFIAVCFNDIAQDKIKITQLCIYATYDIVLQLYDDG